MKREIYQLTAGKIDNLKLLSDELPDPASNEVTIEIKSIGLNFADVFAIWGLYGATPKGAFIPGLEYAGIVHKVGANVSNVQVGDRIMGITRFGAYASHLNIDSHYVMPIPNGCTFQEGAAYLVQVLTAYYGLHHLGNLQEKNTVLIHSAAGGVGIWANRIAKQKNAFTIGSIGSAHKEAFLKKEGYDQVIVRGNDFAQKLKSALGERELSIVMECIGGKILEAGYEALSPMGRMVVYGSARFASPSNRPNYLKIFWQYITRPKIDPQQMIQNNRGLLGFNLIWLYEKVELMQEILEELQKLDLGKAHVGHEFTFDKLPDAIREFQAGKTIGKVVVNH